MPGKKSMRYRLITILFAFIAVSSDVYALDYQAIVAPAEQLLEEFSSGVQIVPGLWEQNALALADSEYLPDEHTELLLNFNGNTVGELMESGALYGVAASGARIQQMERYRGSGSAMVLPGRGIDLIAGQGSMFYPGTAWNDFSMEFWIYPAGFRDGETVFSWNGTSWLGEEPVLQEIRVSARRGRLTWEFDDFFIRLGLVPEQGVSVLSSTVSLESRREILPRTWSHHLVRYDSSSGALEYLIDGISEAITYVSDTGREGGEPLLPYVGDESENRIRIAPNFHGFVDEFRIQREWVSEPTLEIAEDSPGIALVGPVDLGDDSVRITGFSAEFRTPGNTDLRFSIMQRDAYSPISADQITDDRFWSFVEPGSIDPQLSGNASGRYVYMRVEFLPDGSDANIPLLQTVRLSYRRQPAPPAPAAIRSVAGNSSVFLSWSDIPSAPVEGYLLYYGDSPGQYFGTDSDLGPSPVDLGNVRFADVTGLENGKMYYFRIASYNNYNSPQSGLYKERNISREVFARPSRTLE